MVPIRICRLLIRRSLELGPLLAFLILGTTMPPTTMTRTTNSTPSPIVATMLRTPVDPPLEMPTTTARTIIPSTSSMTAAPMITRDSFIWVRPMSLMIRAVIPTLVATIAAAMNNAPISPPPRARINAKPAIRGTITPHTATIVAVLPTFRSSLNGVSRPMANRRKMMPSWLST